MVGGGSLLSQQLVRAALSNQQGMYTACHTSVITDYGGGGELIVTTARTGHSV